MRSGVTVSRLVELRILGVPHLAGPHHLPHHLPLHTDHLPAQGDGALAQLDVHTEHHAPDTHQEDGDEGREGGDEEADHEVTAESEVDRQEEGDDDQGTTQQDQLQHLDQ